jgi:uncharacterized protein with NRDE domain
MCTIVLLNRIARDYPVVVAANRDEMYAREAGPPQRLHERPVVVGGLDLSQGGTWMGVAQNGFFAALTNQRTFQPPDRSLSSRGRVVLDVLRGASRYRARRLLGELDVRRYNDFNLVYGDADGLEVAYARRDATVLEIEPVPHGVHVLTNDRLDSPEFDKVARLRTALAGAATLDDGELEQLLMQLLCDHQHPDPKDVPEPPAGFPRELVAKLGAVCIHTEHYGTRSASLVALSRRHVARYLFADGPPCKTSFQDVMPLLS